MKILKLIYKGILLYITTFVLILGVCGIDSIYNQGYFLYWVIISIILVYTCYRTISEEEFSFLTFSDKFKKWLDD